MNTSIQVLNKPCFVLLNRNRNHFRKEPLTQKSQAKMGSIRPATTANGGGLLRKKLSGVRTWLVLDTTGQSQVLEAGKHSIMRRTGLPGRELRILDPVLCYPSRVLGREKAIVINLEQIKAIITAQEFFLLNSNDSSVTQFFEDLRSIILRLHSATESQEGRLSGGEELEGTNFSDSEEMWTEIVEKDERLHAGDKPSFMKAYGLKILPFEFVVLEACLEAACSSLENEASKLEEEAHPALDKLTLMISTLNLEHVRQIKSRLVAISGRVQKVRDELEHLLDDDQDMAEMYLTQKMMQQHLDGSSLSSNSDLDQRDIMDDEILPPDRDERNPDISTETNETPSLCGASDEIRTSTTSSVIRKNLDVEELEMLLEAYFVQIDGTLHKLSTLKEYVDDTEDYINIMLDDKQNHLLQMGVMLLTATLILSAFIVLPSIFSMNIRIDLFEKGGMTEFLGVVLGGATGSIFLYVVAIAWYKHRRLLV